ncbi:hypothetical protein W911_09465 [Hyphomicrobium nitrativorans NL23]|uniref:Uncharacterized protein n=1 Tax=Hyphomicrobium nitrativorans NL23 TaxID=1029756 RepID=V5SI29_9HYPH|nr:hypothetical protein W911_09465 [Hyphomicrobium nitrativorans NL23]
MQDLATRWKHAAGMKRSTDAQASLFALLLALGPSRLNRDGILIGFGT